MQRGTPAEMAPGLAHICARTRPRRRSHSTETHLVGREEERVHCHRLWLDARGRQQRLENGARAQVERKQRPCANKQTKQTNKQTEALRTVSAVACATQERRGSRVRRVRAEYRLRGPAGPAAAAVCLSATRARLATAHPPPPRRSQTCVARYHSAHTRPCPLADVAGVSPVPVQTWQG